jgi:hypothetical protein
MLFTAKELPGGYAQFIPRWFEVYRRYRDVVIIGVDSNNDHRGFLDNQYLNIVAAAEIWHRIARPEETVLEPIEFERRMGEVLEYLHGKSKKWAHGLLKDKNQPYLARRLESLLNSAQPEVGFRGDPKVIAERMAATRNYLTHREEARREDAAGPLGQVYLMTTVWFCLIAELLKEAGFASGFLRERLGRDVRCRSLRDRDLMAEDEPEDK